MISTAPVQARAGMRARIRHLHDWLGLRMPATRAFVYIGAAMTGFMWLTIVVVAVRRGLHGLSLWTPRMAPIALRSLIPLAVFAAVGLALDWAARRARWWPTGSRARSSAR